MSLKIIPQFGICINCRGENKLQIEMLNALTGEVFVRVALKIENFKFLCFKVFHDCSIFIVRAEVS